MSASKGLRRRLAALAAFAALAGSQAAEAQRVQMDPDNPTCPLNPNVSTYREMRFTVLQRPGRPPVLLAEGVVDANLIPRLQEAIRTFQGDEIWLRSPGGDARVGNQAGRLIREASLQTRIPAGWVCFSACNFLFMGGTARFVDPGGYFMVHMFTHTGDRQLIRNEVQAGDDRAASLINEIEQQSALLASEDNDFLIRMGLSRTLLTEVMYQQRAVADANNRTTRRCLTPAENLRYNVVNPQ